MEAEYLSVDPYMRLFNKLSQPGSPVMGSMVGKIVESKNSKWPVGKRVVGNFGWVTHAVFNPNHEPDSNQALRNKPYMLPDLGDLPASLALGMLGMPG